MSCKYVYLVSHLWALDIKALLEYGEREGNITMSYTTNTTYLRGGIYHHCLGKDLEIPQKRDLRESYKESLSFIWKSAKTPELELIKNKRHGAWLDRSIFQLLKTEVTVTSTMVKGKMNKF